MLWNSVSRMQFQQVPVVLARSRGGSSANTLRASAPPCKESSPLQCSSPQLLRCLCVNRVDDLPNITEL